jgi:hypothetical protein
MNDAQMTQGVSRRFNFPHSLHANGSQILPNLLLTCAGSLLLAVLVGASRDMTSSHRTAPEKSVFSSALTQVPDCQNLGGICAEPIVSALPGTALLESEGLRITNTDLEPLVVNRVTINGQQLAPLGDANCGHVRRLDSRHYPVTLRRDESVPVFVYGSRDPSSFCDPVHYLILDTNRGQFRYSPATGLEPQ